jgi:endonuclease YncB( thermonuclease family)
MLMTFSLVRAIFIVGLCLVASGCWAAELTGRVVGVIDGDTIDLLTPEKWLVRVRLAGIDAPEKRQAFGAVSKQALSDLIFSREVTVNWRKKDRYGRVVGKVLLNGVDTDLKMLELGLAWHSKQYAREQSVVDRKLYAAAEDSARARRAGLWRDAEPVPPSSFRHANPKHAND